MSSNTVSLWPSNYWGLTEPEWIRVWPLFHISLSNATRYKEEVSPNVNMTSAVTQKLERPAWLFGCLLVFWVTFLLLFSYMALPKTTVCSCPLEYKHGGSQETRRRRWQWAVAGGGGGGGGDGGRGGGDGAGDGGATATRTVRLPICDLE